MAPVVKNQPASAGDVKDVGPIPESGRSPEEGTAAHSSALAWRIPWTEEPGGLQTRGSHRLALLLVLFIETPGGIRFLPK